MDAERLHKKIGAICTKNEFQESAQEYSTS